MKLAKNVKGGSMTSMHPALDFVGGVAYVAVNAAEEQQGVTTAIVSSNGDIWNNEEWNVAAVQHGLVPKIPKVSLDNLRWKQDSIQAHEERTLEAPTWSETYEELHAYLDARLVVQDQRYIAVITLFVMMTYFHPLCKVLPILHLLGPTESGKSTIAILLAQIAFNGRVYGSATASSVFRSAHKGRYTQVLTEMDELAEKSSSDSFVRYLQCGTTEAEATVEVTEKTSTQEFRPERYYIFCPRVLASTKPFLAPTLRNRCIQLNINRTPKADQDKLQQPRDEEEEAELRDKMYRLLLLKWQEVKAEQNRLRKAWRVSTGRVLDKFLPLATVASLVSEEVLAIINELATEATTEARRDEGRGYDAVLFRFARYLIKDKDRKLTESQMYEQFIQPPVTLGPYDDANKQVPRWASLCNQTITIEQLKKRYRDMTELADSLKRLALIPSKKESKRSGKGYPYFLSKADIDEKVALHLLEDEEEEEEQETVEEEVPEKAATSSAYDFARV